MTEDQSRIDMDMTRHMPWVVVCGRPGDNLSPLTTAPYAQPLAMAGKLLWIFEGDIHLGVASFLGFRRKGRKFKSIDHAKPLTRVIPKEWWPQRCDCRSCDGTRWWLEWRSSQ